jgi:hypothetical protein
LSFRIIQSEKDLAGFISAGTDETGAMIVVSSKGENVPRKCETETDVIDRVGTPSADYPSVFEAISFVRKAPLWIVAPYGTGSLWGGVAVEQDTAYAFTAGQVSPSSFSFSEMNTQIEAESLGTGNGVQTNFTGNLANNSIDTGTLALYKGVSGVAATESGGDITGADISGTGTLNLTSGAYDFTFVEAPISGIAVTADYVYNKSAISGVSHCVFSLSPYSDDLAIDLEATSGDQFKMTLYQVVNSVDNYIGEYEYSLSREKDNFGKSLYYEDVFLEDPYVEVVVNDDYTLSGSYSVDVSSIDFAGGSRVAPEGSDITTAWNQFQSYNKYKARIFMDVISGYETTLNTLITTYQPYAHGITVMALGTTASTALTTRSSMSLDSDNISIYTNWSKIEDPYNDSYAWISNAGSIGKKYAMMSDIYDSGSPAGVDEDDHGGQLDDWKYKEVEVDYSDAQLKALDDVQINPVVWEDDFGVMAYGDKTAQVSLSDTSFVGHRRMYNYVLEKIINQVLRKQVFKNNDVIHRTRAKAQIDDFIRSTAFAAGAIREWETVCDTTNNTDAILNQRKFIVDLYVKVTPNSQTVHLKLTRLGQGQVIADLVSG